MSGGEVLWRIRSEVRDRVCLYIWPIRRRFGVSPARGYHDEPLVRSAVVGAHIDSVDPSCTEDFSAGELAALKDRSQKLLLHRMSLFDLQNLFLGEQIDWNYEYKAKKRAPTGPWQRIDYRDHAVTGDCKFVWELNRHHHWVVLARAYRLTGDMRYAEEIVAQLDSWIRSCPYGTGMNWRSPLEMGIRLINWVWALELIRPAGLIRGDIAGRLLLSVDQQLREISRRYSRYSSANNHLVGEAAGVFIASSYFHGLGRAARRRDQSRAILSREIVRQTSPDGGNREQAFGYHLFVMELYLLAGLAGRNTGEDFPESYWNRLERMFDFAAAMTEAGAAPVYGDCDDAYILDLDDRPRDFHGFLAVGAVLFNRSDLKVRAGGYSRRAYWLFGPEGQASFDRIDASSEGNRLVSRAFPDSGCYLLQKGCRGCDDRVSVFFDCGGLGFESIAAHGHADALQFTLRAFGVDIIVDPGTYDYFTYGRWRDYFRGTSAHNTIVVDGQDQSEMAGPFMWGRQAAARCLKWKPFSEGGVVAGEHDGYSRLEDPVTHRRTVSLGQGKPDVTITDELLASAEHDAALYLHLADSCQARLLGRNRVRVDCGTGHAVVTLDPSLDVELVTGQVEPILGWVSRGYHDRSPTTTIVGRCRFVGKVVLTTRITLESAVPPSRDDALAHHRSAASSVKCHEAPVRGGKGFAG